MPIPSARTERQGSHKMKSDQDAIGVPASKDINDALDPRDLLVHLRQWLLWNREFNTRHFPDSDRSGHPHGYDGVVIPSWDVLKKLDDIDRSLGKSNLDEGGNL